MACDGAGSLTATAGGGYNNGSGPYTYAIWSESDGGQGRDDSELTYGSSNVFSGLSTKTYYVRVKDNCNNFYTTNISLTPSVPRGIFNAYGHLECVNGKIVYKGYGELRSELDWSELPLDGSYQYKVEVIPNDSDCATATGTPFSPYTPITTFPVELELPTDKKYRVTIKNSCNQEWFDCYDIYGGAIYVNARVDYNCNATPSTNVRLAINLGSNSSYDIVYPATLTVTGNGGYSQTFTLNDNNDLNRTLDVPSQYLPYTVTFKDGCGGEHQQVVNINTGGLDNVNFYFNRSCVEVGNTNLQINLEGPYYGLGNPNTLFELLDANNNVLQTRTGLDWAYNNYIFFNNIPAGQSYKVRVTPPGGSTGSSSCAIVITGEINVPADEGLVFTVEPEVEKQCDGNNLVSFHIERNNGWVSFLLKNLATGEEYTNEQNAVGPGQYSYEVELHNGDHDCDKVRTGTITVDEWSLNPTFTRTLAVACQASDAGPQSTGRALLIMNGFGPFTVQLKGPTDKDFVTVATDVAGPSFTYSPLSNSQTYQFRIVDQCGKTAVQQLTLKPLSAKLISNQYEPCVNTKFTLSAIDFGDPGATYSWKKPDGTTATGRELTFDPYLASYDGTYEVTITLLNGCVIRKQSIVLNSTNCGQEFAKGSIGNYVWYDTNSNGLQDSGESPAANVPVSLEQYVGPANPSASDLANDANWTDAGSKTTDSNGLYLFDGLDTGIYRVRFDPPTGYGITTSMAAGSDPNNNTYDNDSNPGVTGVTGPISINTTLGASDVGRNNNTIDAGLVPAGSIGDYVWLDDNTDGIQNNNEHGVPGVVVKLYKKATNGSWELLSTTQTDSNGKYLFEGLPSGEYQVEFVAPSGKEFTYANMGTSDELDSDADRTTGKTSTITINTALPAGNVGRDNLTVDAGLVPTGALPVKLIDFRLAQSGERSVLLSWATSMEHNSSYFEVLQSSDARSWTSLGKTPAQGNSQERFSYSFLDKEPLNELNYYRLKIVDLDGKFEYSPIKSIRVEAATTTLVTVYPNPARNVFYLQVKAGVAVSKVELFDLNGKVVLKLGEIDEKQPINVSALPTGTYLLKTSLENGTVITKKVVLAQ